LNRVPNSPCLHRAFGCPLRWMGIMWRQRRPTTFTMRSQTASLPVTAIEQPRPLGVLLLDDESLTREGVGALLGRETDIEVLAGVATLAEALASEHDPDVVVAELVLPGCRRSDRTSSDQGVMAPSVDPLGGFRPCATDGRVEYWLHRGPIKADPTPMRERIALP
jgi:hypothetical protein